MYEEFKEITSKLSKSDRNLLLEKYEKRFAVLNQMLSHTPFKVVNGR